MTGKELLDSRQGLVNDLDVLIRSRISASFPVETFNEKGGKTLQLLEDETGERFVVRRFTDGGVNEIEQGGLPFVEAYKAMNRILPSVGISVLPNYLIENEGGYPYTIVCPYVNEGKYLSEAPTDLKLEIANGLGQLLNPELEASPLVTMLHADMFMVAPDAGGRPRVFFIDLDPRMSHKYHSQLVRQLNDALIINRLAELFFDHWCGEDERNEVISALIISLSESCPELAEDFNTTNPVVRAFMDLHLMSNGVDMRGRELRPWL